MDSQRLVDVAMGRKPADLVVRNGRWLCVQTGEIIAATDIVSNPNMQLSLLALVVIPELRISGKGLFDVLRRQFIPVVESHSP